MASFEFIHVPAEDSTVDPCYDLLVDGKKTRVSIQDCRSYGAGYHVNLYGPEDHFWAKSCGNFRSLRAAKERAVEVYRTHNAN